MEELKEGKGGVERGEGRSRKRGREDLKEGKGGVERGEGRSRKGGRKELKVGRKGWKGGKEEWKGVVGRVEERKGGRVISNQTSLCISN